ncbi:hypothetical protein ACMFMG_000917 [Clarireedia jacksonii]
MPKRKCPIETILASIEKLDEGDRNELAKNEKFVTGFLRRVDKETGRCIKKQYGAYQNDQWIPQPNPSSHSRKIEKSKREVVDSEAEEVEEKEDEGEGEGEGDDKEIAKSILQDFSVPRGMISSDDEDMSEEEIETNFQNITFEIPRGKAKIEEAISNMVIDRPYNSTTVAQLVTLAQGKQMTADMRKKIVVYLISKMDAFSCTNLIPNVLKKITSAELLNASISTNNKSTLIAGLLQKAKANCEWGAILQNLAYYYLHKDVEEASAKEIELALSSEKKGIRGSKTSFAKQKVYLDLARTQCGTQWDSFTEDQQGKYIANYQAMKSYGKKLSLIIDDAGYGTGFLLSLSISDGKQIGNLALSKWNNGIAKSFIELFKRHPEAQAFKAFNVMITSFFEDLVLGKQEVEYCKQQVYEYVKQQKLVGLDVSTLLTYENVLLTKQIESGSSNTDDLVDTVDPVNTMVKEFEIFSKHHKILHPCVKKNNYTIPMGINSFRTFRYEEWLDDAALMGAIVSGDGEMSPTRFLVNCLATATVSKKSARRLNNAVHEVYLPVNVGGIHWVAATASKNSYNWFITVYDSLNSPTSREEAGEILIQWLKAHLEAPPKNKEWTFTRQHDLNTTTQPNSYDCGILVVRRIRHMLYNRGPFELNFTTEDGQKLRLEYAKACFVAVQQNALCEKMAKRASDEKAGSAKSGSVKKGMTNATAAAVGDDATVMEVDGADELAPAKSESAKSESAKAGSATGRGGKGTSTKPVKNDRKANLTDGGIPVSKIQTAEAQNWRDWWCSFGGRWK